MAAAFSSQVSHVGVRVGAVRDNRVHTADDIPNEVAIHVGTASTIILVSRIN